MYETEISQLTQQIETLKKDKISDIQILRDIQGKVDAENRKYSGEERSRAEKCKAAMKERDAQIKELEAELSDRRTLQEASEWENESASRSIRHSPVGRELNDADNGENHAFMRYICSRGTETRGLRFVRSMNVGSAGAGTDILPPTDFQNEFWRDLKKQNVIRQYATIRQVSNSPTATVPTAPTRPTRPAYKTTDTANSDTDTGLTTGKRQFTPNKLPVEIVVSNYWLELGGAQAVSFVKGEMQDIVSDADEYYGCIGDGSGEPLGLFTPSADGIPTSRDVECAGQDDIVYRDIAKIYFSVPQRYRNQPNCIWLGNDDFGYRAAAMTNDVGTPLLIPSTAAGVPDRLLGKPFVTCEYVPAVWESGEYVGLFGDMEGYVFYDGVDFGLRAFDQPLYKSDQTVFKSVLWRDHAPMAVRANGFARIKLGTGS